MLMKKLLVILTVVLSAAGAKAQFQNMDFEQWEINSGVPHPSYWNIAQQMGQFGIACDTLESNGGYAMTLSRWYWYGFDDAVQTVAANVKPATLNGIYKYTDNILQLGNDTMPDSAHVYIFAKKWNVALQQNDTIGRGHILLSAKNNWAPFSCPVYYTSNDTPDSLTIRLAPTGYNFEGSNGLCADINGSGYCSFFTVDNLTLSTLSTSVDNEPAPVYNLYPNPASDRLFIATTPGNTVNGYSLCNAIGQVVSAQNQYTPGDGIDISALSPGVYFITLNSKGKLSTQKIIKQ
jgi:Secretion system C-terminal sorting domain